MPTLLGPLVGFALGALFARLARRASGEGAGSRASLTLVALYGALVFAPACAYFQIFAPDWSLFYLVDTRRLPSAIDLAIVLADAVVPLAGFYAGELAARARSPRASLAMIAAPLGIALLLVLAFAHELAIDATYQKVHGDFGTERVAGGPLGLAILWMGAMIAVGTVLVTRALGAVPSRPTRPTGPTKLLGRSMRPPR